MNIYPHPDTNFNPGATKGGIINLEDLISTPPASTTPNNTDKPDDVIVESVTPKPVLLDTLIEGGAPPAPKPTPEHLPNPPAPSATTGEFSPKATATKFIELGIWKPIEKVVLEDGTEVAFEDADVTEEMLQGMAAYQAELRETELLQGKVDINGASDFTKKLIEIEKKGGSVADALKVYETVQNPLAQIDIETPQGHKEACIMLMKLQKKTDEEINILLEGYEAKGQLEAKGHEAYSALNDAVQKHYESLEAQAEQAANARKEALKTYKKSLKDEITKFGLNEATQRKLLDLATKENNTKTFDMDKLYNEKRANPAEAKDLVYFLADPEGFLAYKLEEKLTQYKKNQMGVFKFTKKEGTDSIHLNNQKPRANEGLSIDELAK